MVLCGIPASSSSAASSVQIRASAPFQNEQNGSSSGSPGLSSSPAAGLRRPERNAASAAPGRSATRSTSQSAHLVNPGRYSAPHFGQFMPPAYNNRLSEAPLLKEAGLGGAPCIA